MEFYRWAKNNHLNDVTIQLLRREEMDSFPILKECSHNDIDSLSISKGQKIILRKAVAELVKEIPVLQNKGK